LRQPWNVYADRCGFVTPGGFGDRFPTKRRQAALETGFQLKDAKPNLRQKSFFVFPKPRPLPQIPHRLSLSLSSVFICKEN
jgi:hypothetical protein